ncbi:hypothetical protein FDP41_001566 [Naegleria fowleri]|uniref:Uncharacterized protein n=1 Tax=Naegleria fowleri TaxID=5763 RepID=A0A6A5BMI5_NAEFO|nr:uncharacterized protein FDP41_001566 [Naegleria fowleri]KAF0979223.1 hypothetical protein FDP41_001566 [Naegleria fowleri]
MKKEEDLLRNLYVIDRDNSMLDDPYLHLVSVYGPDHQLRELEFSKYEPPKGIGLLFDFEDPDFFLQFNAFTYDLFKDMDWSNCFVAGGSVLAAALKVEQIKLHLKQKKTDKDEPNDHVLYDYDNDGGDVVEQTHKVDEDVIAENSDDDYFTDSSDCNSDSESSSYDDNDLNTKIVNPERFDSSLAEYYSRSDSWKNSDIDLFFYGLSEQQAEKKIIGVYNLIKKNLSKIPKKFYKVDLDTSDRIDDIVTYRTEHAITFRFNYPIRPIQII